MGNRLLGAFAGACVVVALLTVISASLIRWWDDRERSNDPARNAQPVALAGYSSLDLAEILGEPRYQLPEAPVAPPPPPLSARQISGFVIVEVVVDEQGRATSAKVVTATPSGLYEDQAVRDALDGIYPANAPGRQDAVIRFSVDADTSSKND
ncbi:MAG: energy transducer TonB [Woeseiaceae bacterium]